MRRILGMCLIVGNLFAVPPCEQEQIKICVILYKGAMSSEANVINTTNKKALIEGKISLDGRIIDFKDWTILPNETITMLKSKYDDPNQKPRLGYENFTYKFID